jgi:hypothetical protein
MRYISYENSDGETITLSEDEIRENFFPQWKRKMLVKYDNEYFEKTFSFEECLNDFIVEHKGRISS